MKTIPLSYPYSDNLSKTTKNMNQPMSKQHSRENSISDLNDLDEISHEVLKKKKIKKKIIKTVKKKNPDGTDGPAEVTTIIIE